jgi:hypothetical protein
MRPTDVNWQLGQVVYWDLDSVDPNKPLTDQLSELKEDLAQVIYPGALLIDIGWHPEFSKDGAFLVSVISNEDWANPVMQENCSTMEELIRTLDTAIALAQRRNGKEI